ncbi:MAG TPA: hypothetical protein VF625_01800, partial [Longimicrobium sp.]
AGQAGGTVDEKRPRTRALCRVRGLKEAHVFGFSSGKLPGFSRCVKPLDRFPTMNDAWMG